MFPGFVPMLLQLAYMKYEMNGLKAGLGRQDRQLDRHDVLLDRIEDKLKLVHVELEKLASTRRRSWFG